MWSAVMPFCWVLALALRVLGWQIWLFNRDVYRRTVEAAVQEAVKVVESLVERITGEHPAT